MSAITNGASGSAVRAILNEVTTRLIFADLAAVEADTTLTYTADQAGTITEGDHVYALAEMQTLRALASGASSPDVTTAGGVKLAKSGSGLVQVNQRSWVLNSEENVSDPAAELNILIAAGSGTQPCFIGVDEAWPVKGQNDSELTTFLGWGADDYTSGAGISSIVGGYDNVVNAGASAIFGSYHSMIAYGDNLHNTIVGGSDCFISGEGQGDDGTGRAGIFNARRASIRAGIHGTILGGDYVRITENAGNYCTIINGNNHDIDSGRENFIIGGTDNSITGEAGGSGSNRSGILGGQGNEIAQALDSVIVGGANNYLSHNGAMATGRDVKSVGPGNHHGVDKIVEAGDAQAAHFVGRIQTTDASNTSVRFYGIGSGSETNIILPAISAGTGRALLIGMNVANGAQVSYMTNFGFMYDGTNTFLFKTGTETSKAASTAVLTLDLISQANNAQVVGTAPRLQLATNGLMNARLNGAADTTINWVLHIDFVMTRVTPA